MISNIRYLKSQTTKSVFEAFEIESKGGNIVLTAVPSQPKIVTQEEGLTFFIISIDANISGIDKDNPEQNVFDCSAKVDISFVCLDEKTSDDEISKLVKENRWFFEGYIGISLKKSLESVLSNTRYKDLEVPIISTDDE